MTHKQSGEKTPDCFKQEKEKTQIANTWKNSKTPIFLVNLLLYLEKIEKHT